MKNRLRITRLFLMSAVLVIVGYANAIAQSNTNFLITGIARLADKKASDRGRIAEEIAHFASSNTDHAELQKHVKDLIAFLKDDDDTVRYWVAMTLGHIGAPAMEAVPALIVALDDRVDTIASKSSESGIRFALDKIDSSWRSRIEVSEKLKRRWPNKK